MNPHGEPLKERRILRDGTVDEVLEVLGKAEDALADGRHDPAVLEVQKDWIRIQYLRDMLIDLESRIEAMKSRSEDTSDLRKAARAIRDELVGVIEVIYE